MNFYAFSVVLALVVFYVNLVLPGESSGLFLTIFDCVQVQGLYAYFSGYQDNRLRALLAYANQFTLTGSYSALIPRSYYARYAL